MAGKEGRMRVVWKLLKWPRYERVGALSKVVEVEERVNRVKGYFRGRNGRTK